MRTWRYEAPRDYGPTGHVRLAGYIFQTRINTSKGTQTAPLRSLLTCALHTFDSRAPPPRATPARHPRAPSPRAISARHPRVPSPQDYFRAEDDETPFDDAQMVAIHELIATRMRAKMARKFDEADRCLDQLSTEYNIFMNDKLKGWRADGKAFPTHMRIEGDGDEDEELVAALDEDKVMELLAARSIAKKDADYDEADAIVATLRNDYSVAIDDKRGSWRLVVQSGGYFRIGSRVDPFMAKKVGDLLTRRSAHQAAQEYEEADALHAELQELGISLDTRQKTWRFGKRENSRNRNRW